MALGLAGAPPADPADAVRRLAFPAVFWVSLALLALLRRRRATARRPDRLVQAAFLLLALDTALLLAGLASPGAEPAWLAAARRLLHLAAAPLLLTVYWIGQAGTLRRSEAALREAGARHRRLFEAVPDPLLAVDLSARVADANAAALAALGLARAALVGRPAAACFAEGEAVQQAMRDALTGRPVRDLEATLGRPGAAPRQVLLDATAFGEGVLISLRDVTELRRADAARRTMERAVAEAQRLESLGVLAAGVAHDFNNLLAVALANGTEALAALPGDSAAREPVQALVSASQRAADLTRQMMACAGGALAEPTPVALGPLARELGALLRASVGASKPLTVEGPVEGPVLQADPTQLRQVLTNLVLNAAEAMGDRPGRIAVRVREADLDAAALAEGMVPEAGPGRYAVLEVADDGPGMDEPTRARIFEPFFTTKATGRGLGLASVMGVVRGHGGAIQVETEAGRGTTFRVLLPLPAAAPAPAARPGPPGAVPPRDDAGRARRVLVVDDDDLVRGSARRLLRAAGHEVHLAAGGIEALRFLEVRAAELDAVLLDLTMPGMDGVEVLRAMRARWPGLAVVISSGWAGEETRRRLGGLAVEAVARKPWGPQELDQAVARACAAREAARRA